MITSNELLLDSYLLRSILLERLANGYSNQIIKEYKLILDDIILRLNKEDDIGLNVMNKLIKELQEKITPEIKLATDMQDLAINEALFVQGAINGAVGINILNKLPPDNTLLRIASTPLYMGSTLMETFKQFDNNLKYDLQSEIRQGVIQGETIAQIKRRIKERFGIVERHSQTIARTATATLVNNVRDKIYNENEDIFKAYQHHATLDSRTTFICAVRDGLKWQVGDVNKPIGHNLPYKRPPLHHNCRSLLLPITKSYKELGLDIDEIPEGTRASMDGQVPASITFTKWFGSKSEAFQEKYLGTERFKLYRDGKINLSQLINKNGEILTLKQLKELYS